MQHGSSYWTFKGWSQISTSRILSPKLTRFTHKSKLEADKVHTDMKNQDMEPARSFWKTHLQQLIPLFLSKVVTVLLAEFRLHSFFTYLQSCQPHSPLLPLALQSHPVMKENQTLSLLTFQVKGNRGDIIFTTPLKSYVLDAIKLKQLI